MKYTKIENFLKTHNFNFSNFAKLKNQTKQTIYYKKTCDSFSIDDLIEIGMLTDTQLVLINKKKKVVLSFDESDLTDKEVKSLNFSYLNELRLRKK